MMRSWLLSELEMPLGAHLSGHDSVVQGVSIDSRSTRVGDLFVAINGDNFDGHDYLGQAERAGAVAALISAERETSLPVLKVDDCQKALGLLGAYNRSDFAGMLVAITGSAGKTTVKNMVRAVLSQKGATLATRGNFNNEIGVPLTLLDLAPEHQFAVVEMGAARIGDIGFLAELGRPSVAVLLNAMPAHLQGFGTVEDVARAKGEILDGLEAGDVAIINADQPWAEQWRKRAGEATVLDFGFSSSAAITAQAIETRGLEGVTFTASTPQGDFSVSLQVPGEHNVLNALAAIAVGIACEISIAGIKQGLASVAAVAGRLAILKADCGANLVDDCYNANPGSVKAAIDLLAQCEGRRTLVLGAMKELGPDSEALHIEVARYARAAGIEQLWGVGEELRTAVQAFASGGRFFPDRQAVVAAATGAFSPADTVLLKGSRSAGMELVLKALATAQSDFGS